MSTHIYKPSVTLGLYLIVISCYLICHIDNGILGIAKEPIKKDLNITESNIGLLQSGVYIGNVLGSLISPKLFAKIEPKKTMVASAILNGLFVSAFAFIKDFWVLLVTRILVGLFQGMFVIYFPVWIDLCAPPKS